MLVKLVLVLLICSFILIVYLFIIIAPSNPNPLSTNNRWIIDDSTGKRAKLFCANWAGHLQPMIPEGLDKKPLEEIVSQIVKQKFNCVRLTYATYMWTRYKTHVVEDTLVGLGLHEVVEGIGKSNPFFLKMTHVQVFEAVVKELGDQSVRVLLDNHVSKPKWCCGDEDGNGFFSDKLFNPIEWLQGLVFAAKHFQGNHIVVAMSLRNELRGPHQNKHGWYMYMTMGARAIHETNPHVLVVVSGLSYDTDLQFLKRAHLKLDLGKKLVYETHLYSWSGVGIAQMKEIWTLQPLNSVCASCFQGLDNQQGFVTIGKHATPLIFTEFGFDQSGTVEADNRFLTCLQTYLLRNDFDWALWAFQGGYYTRDDQLGIGEPYGVMDASWDKLRYPNFTQKFQLLQRKNQDPTSKRSKEFIFYYPLTGQCVQLNKKDEVQVGNCETKDRWMHDGDGANVHLVSTKKCLIASGEGIPVTISDDCQSKNSTWTFVSPTKLHLATMDQNGENLCLQKEQNSTRIVTSRCICIGDDSTCLDDPQSQWFQLVPTNV